MYSPADESQPEHVINDTPSPSWSAMHGEQHVRVVVAETSREHGTREFCIFSL